MGTDDRSLIKMKWTKANEVMWEYNEDVAYRIKGEFMGFTRYHNIVYTWDKQHIEWMPKATFEHFLEKVALEKYPQRPGLCSELEMFTYAFIKGFEFSINDKSLIT